MTGSGAGWEESHQGRRQQKRQELEVKGLAGPSVEKRERGEMAWGQARLWKGKSKGKKELLC